ncbi:uncharacterized protein LOC136719328 [Amia ocellicauda]|uniref:uncharacterized protein LOC136719328 n=1 Tax=Amia ocellicauda TaxID=2972642 RepID=UPI003463CFAA
MKAFLVLLLLLPLCTAFTIECYGEDFLMVQNQLLRCSSRVPQVCYTRETGEKGCTTLAFCKHPGWKCCDTNRCNA